MNDEWWEGPSCFLCDRWWVLLIALILGLAAYFGRGVWLPALGIDPRPAQALGTGDVQVTLSWESPNDLDLWVTDPAGETIFFQHRVSASGGILDVDANAGCGDVVQHPVENVFWPQGQAPQGEYKVEAQFYRECDTQSLTAFHVRLLIDGQVTGYDRVIQSQGERQLIARFVR